ncbi:MAG TPA: hypothetical protein DCR40_19060 [Prolixibacteraceae bacterium]|nr:hypothetical protein [Prolixibacteraceae bacterium]
MKKFAANYLVSDSGIFLKNGIVVANDDGTVVEFIDTEGDLREIAQLLFFNGILITNCRFVKTPSDLPRHRSGDCLKSLIIRLVAELNEVTILNLIETGIQIQSQFPGMTIPEILLEITNFLLIDGKYSRQIVPGIFLLTGVNLTDLHFTPKSKLKKIL